jgi:hypothetical protein
MRASDWLACFGCKVSRRLWPKIKATNPRAVKRITPMSEHNQSSKFTDESAAIAQETVEKGKAAEQSTRATVENILDSIVSG